MRQIVGLTDGDIIAVQHRGSARYSTDATGTKWIRKRASESHRGMLLAEVASWCLGRLLDVPIPAGAVAGVPHEEASWLSQYVASAPHWDPSSMPYIENPEGLGAMLVLDVLVLNEDRHAANILLEPLPGETHLKAWAIDHGSAVIGDPLDFAKREDDTPDPFVLAEGFPIDVVKASAMAVAEKAASLSASQLGALCALACRHSGDETDAAPVLTRVLTKRCAAAKRLVNAYLLELEVLRK